MLAAFVEIGPCHTNGETTEINPFSWNVNANILFLDQPPNTGFSSSDEYFTSSAEVGVDTSECVRLFARKFPQYSRNIHLFGSSYAGHYVGFYLIC
jgi:cathepsin A (carboxypeptidase C)